jgi:hypothetical protein
MIMMRRLRFFAATPSRGTSIEERFGVNPAGRTIVLSLVLSFGCRWGVTARSKRPESATELNDGVRSAYHRHSRGHDQD